MRMDNVALAKINSFASTATRADFVPPSEQLVTLTYGQLQELITQAAQNAIQPLQDETMQLRKEIAQDREEIATLRAKIDTLDATEAEDVTRICRDIAQDRKRITKLEMTEPQPMQKDRGEILRALLVANGGKMLAKDARNKMHLSRSAFSQLIATMKDDIELKQFHLKKNQKVIILRSCLAKQ
jgi:predicted RNase H-like nuclease (RuvC/YqgF family)